MLLAAHVVARSVGAGISARETARCRAFPRRIRQARKDEMDDVVGQIVLAIGDEDLLPGDPVSAVADRLRAGAHRRQSEPA